MVSWRHTYKISAKPKLVAQAQVYYYGVTIMEVSYKKLWKLLIDKDMKKKDLQALTGLSASSIAKLSRDEMISMDALMKICAVFGVQFSDVVEIVYENTDNTGQ